jgi:hypothetical protein
MLSAIKWSGRKLDVMADEAAKSIGKTIGPTLVALGAVSDPHLRSAFAHAYDALANWLHVVTSTPF